MKGKNARKANAGINSFLKALSHAINVVSCGDEHTRANVYTQHNGQEFILAVRKPNELDKERRVAAVVVENLNDEGVAKLQALYKKEMGVEVTKKEILGETNDET